jgi:hypothetical protein
MERLPEQLCTSCTKCGKGLCSWDASKGNVPVEGWNAVRNDVWMMTHGQRAKVISYRILDCPLYEKDPTAEARTPKNYRISVVDDDDIIYWYYHGLSSREIGSIVGLKTAAIQARIKNLKRRGEI